MSKSNSYSQILKSSSLIAGSRGVSYVVGLLQTKVVAVLLGPSGMGLVGLYTSTLSMIQTFAGLGIGSSAVHEVATANGNGNAEEVAKATRALRRLCWITGVLGWLLCIGLSWPLSQWTFQSKAYAPAFMVMGATLLFSSISGGQMGLIQGIRKIGDIAKIGIFSVLIQSFFAIGIYTWLGEKGVVPVIIGSSIFQLLVTWYYARRIEISKVDQTWRETLGIAKRLLSLGMLFMWSALLMAAVTFLVRGIIVRELGLEANGYYHSARGISSVFAGFIIEAMMVDFYPRLMEAAQDDGRIRQLVNEQTEIGLLLALPGLLGSLTFAPWAMTIFYSSKFLAGAELLPWFILGIYGRIISWPLAYILLAKGRRGWMVASDTACCLTTLALSYLLIMTVGLVGTAVAIPLSYLSYTIVLLVMTRKIVKFAWSESVLRVLFISMLLVVVSFASRWLLPVPTALVIGGGLTVAATLFSLRGIASRLDAEHRLVRFLNKIPVASYIIRY